MTGSFTYDAFRAQGRMPALDGVRAFAVLGVLLSHTRDNPFAILHGYRGVLMFFVLSGFLITTLALREEAARGFVDLRDYFIRRFFRIVPLYFLVLLAAMAWVFAFHMEGNAERFRHYLWTYFAFSPEFPIFEHAFQIPLAQSWSLGIEEKFYLLWPVLAFGLMVRSRHRFKVTVGLIALTGALNAATAGPMAQMWGAYMDILLGCLLALLLHARKTYERIAILGDRRVAWLVIAALGLALLSPLTRTQFGERYFAMLAALAIAAVVTGDNGPAKFLSRPWLVELGALSYGIYLLHLMGFNLVNRFVPTGPLGDIMTVAANLAVVLPFCWWLHVYVEQPMIAFGRALTAGTRAPRPIQQSAGTSAAPAR